MMFNPYPARGLLIHPACLSHQVHEDSPAVLLTCPMPCGVIPPRSTAHIPLALETQVTGEYRSIVYISIFGSPDPPMVRANFLNYS